MMNSAPLVSFIVLSYNYRHYIGRTIESILAQTMQDFEIIVIDDRSSDGSAQFVRSLGDPRIVVIENEVNLGGAASFNRAFAASRGRLISNVDSDDWIAPSRTERQLALLECRPDVDIAGTHVRFMDSNGEAHPQAAELESYLNYDWAPNKVESWVVQNRLCRSSTMVRRSFHETYGLYDPDMVYAPDFEVWTRALRHDRRFAVVQEALTFYRLHDKGITHANALGTFTEICSLLAQNIIPTCNSRGVPTLLNAIGDWIVSHQSFAELEARLRLRLLGLVFASDPPSNFRAFHDRMYGTDDWALEVAGANLLALLDTMQTSPTMTRMRFDLAAVTEARDWWRQQAEAYRSALAAETNSKFAALQWWRGQANAFEAALAAANAHRDEADAGKEAASGQSVVSTQCKPYAVASQAGYRQIIHRIKAKLAPIAGKLGLSLDGRR